MYSMKKIKYERVGDKFFPIANVELTYKDNSVVTKAYVDSGATYSIFNAELADILGLDYKKGELTYPIGIGGHICAYLNKIMITIQEVKIPCGVLFSDEFVVNSEKCLYLYAKR